MNWLLAHSLVQLQAELDARWPDRIRPDWTIGDAAHLTRPSDHNPRPGDGAVCAIDIRGAETARAVWDHLLRSRDHRVKYMIFGRQIVSSTIAPWIPRAYTGTNPHLEHIHISVGWGPDGRSSGPVDDPSPWGIRTATTLPPLPPSGVARVDLPVLRQGHRSGAVRSLQVLLKTKAGQDIAVDSDFGPGTRQAVLNVQRFFRLHPDGVVGAETWPTLFL